MSVGAQAPSSADLSLAGLFRRLGLTAARQRLVLLYLLAAGPLLLLLALGTWADRANALRNARNQAEAIVREGIEQQQDMRFAARNLLTVLALVPEVRTGDEACGATLRMIAAQHPHIVEIDLLAPTGQIACSSQDVRPVSDLVDQAFVQRALSLPAGEVALSDIAVSRSTGHPSMTAAMQVRDPRTGQTKALLSAVFDLDWLSGLVERGGGVAGTMLRVIDAGRGLVVVQVAGRVTGAEVEAADPALLDAIRDMPQGGTTVIPINGEVHTASFAPWAGTGLRLVLVAAVPKAEVLASSNYHLTLNALGFVAAAIAAIILAWLAADRSLLRPIRKLAAAATNIGDGNLGSRIGDLPGAVEELKSLANSFDAMATSLRMRDERIVAMGHSIAESEEHHRLLANNAGDVIARFDRNFIRTYISPAFRDVLGFEPAEFLGETLQSAVIEEDRAGVHADLLRPLMNGADTARSTYRVTRSDGRVIWIETFGRRLLDGSGFVTVERDVSLQKELEAQLEMANKQLRVQVMQDPLTGIANRRRFDEMLGFEYQRAQRLHEPLTLLMIDIDHFKHFNDTFGHLVGDECLRSVATALDQALRRPGDLVGRYGGEEFAILLPGTPLAGALIVSERIRTAVSRIVLPAAAAHAKSLTVSIGGATTLPPVGADGPVILVQNADIALYKAKHDGRDCVKVTMVHSTMEPADG